MQLICTQNKYKDITLFFFFLLLLLSVHASMMFIVFLYCRHCSECLRPCPIQPEKQLEVKIRHASKAGDSETPFSAYTKFLSPKENAGQEAIWVEGENDGNLIAHTTGLLNVKRFYLDPAGAIAMEGNRYPIWEIGFRNLLVKMAEIRLTTKLFLEPIQQASSQKHNAYSANIF